MRALLLLSLFASVAISEPPKSEPPKPASPYEGEGWKVRADAPKDGKIGVIGKLAVSVETRAGYHLNDDYPLRFDAATTPGVTFASPRVDKAAATLAPCKGGEHACRAEVPVAFTPSAEGTLHVAGTLSFSACDDAHCLIEKVPVALDVAVTK